MIIPNTLDYYKTYITSKATHVVFSDTILYRMCEEFPYHDDQDVAVGKLVLIGRTYAAAIERRRNADVEGDAFYETVVGPKMLEIGPELDRRLKMLRQESEITLDNIIEMLSVHKFLMDAFREITGMEKRSLASKYLHFHCPELFFIYDSRAREAIHKLVKRADKSILENAEEYDTEYGDFVCRMWELRKYLHETLGVQENPRKLDGFLLTGVK